MMDLPITAGSAAKRSFQSALLRMTERDAGLHVGGGEGAAVERAKTEDREKIFGDLAALEALRLAVTGEFFGGILKDGDGREGSGGGAYVGEIEEREAEVGEIEERAASGEIDEGGGTREWERAQEDGVDYGEDGGVGADAEGEGEDGDDGEGGRFL